jgi:hypothetical protein
MPASAGKPRGPSAQSASRGQILFLARLSPRDDTFGQDVRYGVSVTASGRSCKKQDLTPSEP